MVFNESTLVHTTFKLGFERILPLLDNPPTNDLFNFLGYCETWANGLIGHHDGEELIVFPFLQQKIDMSTEIEEHKLIQTNLNDILALVRAAQADSSKFDAPKLKEIMENIKAPLFQHLDDEITRIAPQNMKVFEADDIQNMMNKLEEHAHKDDVFKTLPYILTHTAPEYKSIWPEMPWFVRKVITPYVFALRHSGYWKYSPYGF